MSNDCSMHVCIDSLSFPGLIVMMSSSSRLPTESGVLLVLFIARLSAKVLLGLSFSLHDSLIALFRISMNLSTGSNSPSGLMLSPCLNTSSELFGGSEVSDVQKYWRLSDFQMDFGFSFDAAPTIEMDLYFRVLEMVPRLSKIRSR